MPSTKRKSTALDEEFDVFVELNPSLIFIPDSNEGRSHLHLGCAACRHAGVFLGSELSTDLYRR